MSNSNTLKQKNIKLDRSFDQEIFQKFNPKAPLGWKAVPNLNEEDVEWGSFIANESVPLYGGIEKTRRSTSTFLYLRPQLEIVTNEGTFYVDQRLNLIINAINNSKHLLELKDDWDDEDAIGCNFIILDRSINLLLKYSQNVLKYHDVIVYAPEISLGKDGSIDLEWRCKDRVLLINILNVENFQAEYYGNDFKSKTIIKGTLDNYSINRTLSFWMQNLV